MKIQPSNLKYSLDLPFFTKKVKLENETYKEGDLIEFDYSAGTGKKLATPANFYGIVAEEVKIDGKVTHGTVYISGIFNKKAINKESHDLEKLEQYARPLNIMFK
ncbi:MULTISPECIES: hypothetical protein [unclassified Fusobacterium]|uniref:hypothetical protein n=1 Tax=unclassified Fusobacterium TaxID=2648384 RepID=UPI001B8AA180|nr:MULTISPECIES: hypothetical protein [unclassified Fusobacterium]MBR8701452.1 hypothetical protein [Fusobacterium sp. DD45]MBR8711220.1 hypothetical protein [Fusobacterium sp. DD28]MBR8751787.1 hypothetical protein [Fusobacterium sp. DD26]